MILLKRHPARRQQARDYVVTRYIAEFINTLSSVTYILYGLYGLYKLGEKRRTPVRVLSYCGLMGVGVCSGGYHMTLKYHTQMSDELSMHLLTTPVIYRILTFHASPERTRLIGIVLTVLFTVVMVTHMAMDEFLLHATSFGLGVYIIATRVLKMIKEQVRDARVRNSLRKIARFGVCSFAFGYFVWLLDDWLCSQLTSMKSVVGRPLAFLLEFHGWWHIFTAIGGYIGVALVDAITSGEVHEDPSSQLAWPIPLAAKLMPDLEPLIKKE
ncbi:hypothetical protein K4F52_009746 [Lecanicillium sp. MT-2017a]|nr:hypothetical protein K4F52_009746 [Lecanicillium sp. MT-2017a]